MDPTLDIGIVGDWNPQARSHLATNQALLHAGQALAAAVHITWLPTESLHWAGTEAALARFDALWCAPGSPYRSMEGALRAIQFARERGKPFIGT
jgi:CTP synthase (UTP-ammonia lyase)